MIKYILSKLNVFNGVPGVGGGASLTMTVNHFNLIIRFPCSF